MRICPAIVIFAGFCSALVPLALCAEETPAKLPPPAGRTVDFVKDVQPILAASCLKCHGPERAESGYRVDVKSVALTGGDSFAPNVLSGKSADSPLIQFVAGQVDGMQMPAKGPLLSVEQIGILRAWIDQGATWPDEASAKLDDPKDWWSLQPLVAIPIPLPASSNPRFQIQNPIDAFIVAKLTENGLLPSHVADRRVLLRRVYFDLIGLPPAPAEIDDFLADDAPDAYERLVDRLLASPRHGERWARHWMDAAHFAESHGHDQDRIRENAWPYRDYLIRAFNADKPYGRFIEEQVAADALYPDDAAAVAALGFLAAGPWDESTLKDIREDTLDRQIGRYLDRDDMLSTVLNNVSSMTVQCARCHDHKFDPIPQADYYALQAVFAGVERANRSYDRDPQVARQRRDLLAQEKRLAGDDPAVVAELLSPEVQAEVAVWEKEAAGRMAAWQVLTPESFSSAGGATLTKQSDDSLLSGGPKPDKDTVTITAAPSTLDITAVRLEVLTDDNLPQRGPGRQDNGNLHLSEIQLFAAETATGTSLEISRAIADFDQAGWDITRAIDGNEATAWGIHPNVGQPHEAVFELKQPLKLVAGGKLTVVLKQLHGSGHLIGRARLSVTNAPPPVRLGGAPANIAAILATSTAQRTAEQRVALALFQQLDKLGVQLAALPKPALIYAAASDFEPQGGLKPPPGPRPIHMLRRGDIRQPLAEAQPGALSCLSLAGTKPGSGVASSDAGTDAPGASSLPAKSIFALPPGHPEAARRGALAKWLTHERNALTWRSIVNRVWHHHFSRGIVETPNDFGRMGAKPTHPELLDWLATDFLARSESLKDLHRQIVTSGTYRQTSTPPNPQPPTPSPLALDADNALLWRMHRARLDAECVRDAVLAAANRLDLRMGGSSDRQFELQPGRHVTPMIDYTKFDLDSPAGQRRSVYRFLFRTLPDPFMEALDCPAGDQITPARTNTVTVQQALAMWNDAFILRQCEHLAERIARDAGTTQDRVGLAFRLVLTREPTVDEAVQLSAYTEKHGLANFCRVLLNSNEFVFVE